MYGWLSLYCKRTVDLSVLSCVHGTFQMTKMIQGRNARCNFSSDIFFYEICLLSTSFSYHNNWDNSFSWHIPTYLRHVYTSTKQLQNEWNLEKCQVQCLFFPRLVLFEISVSISTLIIWRYFNSWNDSK